MSTVAQLGCPCLMFAMELKFKQERRSNESLLEVVIYLIVQGFLVEYNFKKFLLFLHTPALKICSGHIFSGQTLKIFSWESLLKFVHIFCKTTSNPKTLVEDGIICD